jgi:hypothetical protein
MQRRWRFWLLGVAVLLVVPFAAEWMWARARVGDILMESSLDSPSVVADGKDSVVLTVRVTEEGKPRGGDLLQTWIDDGSGLFVPDWAYADGQGMAEFTFWPNPTTRYDSQDAAVLHIRDVSIGRLIEVGKDLTVTVPLAASEGNATEEGGFLSR